jgi:hypothetical protein
MTESQLGLIEASMYVGIIFGSLVCPFLFAKFSPKLLIMGALLFNSLAVSSWAVTDNYWTLAGFRVLNGFVLVSNHILPNFWKIYNNFGWCIYSNLFNIECLSDFLSSLDWSVSASSLIIYVDFNLLPMRANWNRFGPRVFHAFYEAVWHLEMELPSRINSHAKPCFFTLLIHTL